jgi:hypothetical protein
VLRMGASAETIKRAPKLARADCQREWRSTLLNKGAGSSGALPHQEWHREPSRLIVSSGALRCRNQVHCVW